MDSKKCRHLSQTTSSGLKKLPLSFYQRDTITVAKELLGQKLVRIYHGQRLSGIITEVEAYLGMKDKACHTYSGKRTPRTEAMYLPGGHSYIYQIYGLYYCFNIVTENKNTPEAVLIRALQPLEGLQTMSDLRKTKQLKSFTTGPGKLAQALALTKNENTLPLNSNELFIELNTSLTPFKIHKTTRIGVDYADDHAKWPLRFYIKDNDFISKK